MITHTLAACLFQRVPGPPPTRREELVDVLHGVEVADPYRWLEDQRSPETREWIDRQIAFTEQAMAEVSGVADLRDRLEALSRVDRLGVPTIRGRRHFLHKRSTDQEHPVFCVREGRDGADRVLIDPHTLSDDLSVTAAVMEISQDGKRLIYGLRAGGEDELSLRVMDVDTGEDAEDGFPRARYFGASFVHDGSAFYYSVYDDEGCRLLLHTVGSPLADDRVIFGEGYGPGIGIGGQVSDNGRWLVVVVSYGAGAKRSDVHVQDLATGAPFECVVSGIDAVFWPDVAGDTLYLQTDWQAPRGRILSLDLTTAVSLDAAREVIPEGDGVIDSVALAGDKVVLRVLEEVQPRLRLYEADGTPAGEIQVDSVGALSGLFGRWGQDAAFYSFSTYHVPDVTYEYSVATGESSIWHRPEIPFDPEGYATELEWAVSPDGTRVPLFVCRRRDLALDGSHPSLLTGYGGFAIPMSPGFDARCAVWVERGGVFAVACLRGGGEFGEAWHEAGMLERKQNVFDDFVAASEYLISTGCTSADRLAIAGGSNGGLLVGAALTQRPDLYRAVLCGYPLLDMVRYHRFLQAAFWVPEYGSADDPEQFRYLHAYSPYHRVEEGVPYPAVMFDTGDADTRVDPLHARKMCARLQYATGSGHPVLLHYDTQLGHSDGRPVSRHVADLATTLGFLMWQVGLPLAAPSTS